MNAAEEQLVDYLLKDKDFTYLMDNCLPKELKVAMTDFSNEINPREKAYKIVNAFLQISSAYYRKTFLFDYVNDYLTTDDNLEMMKNVIVNNLFLVACLDRLVQNMKTSPIAGYTIEKKGRSSHFNPFSAVTAIPIDNPAKDRKVDLMIYYKDNTQVSSFRVSALKHLPITVEIEALDGSNYKEVTCSLSDLKSVLEYYLKNF